jgi:replicative DNA helicase
LTKGTHAPKPQTLSSMTPPNNVPAERHLLGVLLRDALPFPPDLNDDFFEPAHADIAQAICSLQSMEWSPTS